MHVHKIFRRFDPSPQAVAYRVIAITRQEHIDYLQRLLVENQHTDSTDQGAKQLRLVDDLMAPQTDLILEEDPDGCLKFWVSDRVWADLAVRNEESVIANFVVGATVAGLIESDLGTEQLNDEVREFLLAISN